MGVSRSCYLSVLTGTAYLPVLLGSTELLAGTYALPAVGHLIRSRETLPGRMLAEGLRNRLDAVAWIRPRGFSTRTRHVYRAGRGLDDVLIADRGRAAEIERGVCRVTETDPAGRCSGAVVACEGHYLASSAPAVGDSTACS